MSKSSACSFIEQKSYTNSGYIKFNLGYLKKGLIAKLSASAFRVYCYLLYNSDINDFSCIVSHLKIAINCGLTRQSVSKKVNELEKHGFIEIEKVVGNHGKQASNYRICPAEEVYKANNCLYEEKDLVGHCRIQRELFHGGYFARLGKKHGTWKIYCCLLVRADFTFGYAFPSYDTLASDSGLSRVSVSNAIKDLLGDGLIRLEKISKEKGRNANGYYVWPLCQNIQFNEYKKQTSKSKNCLHLKVNKLNSKKYNKLPSQDVKNMYCNKETRNNTTISSVEGKVVDKVKIDKLLKCFYAGNRIRHREKMDYVRKWLEEMVANYGEAFVGFALEQYRDKYAISVLTTCMENLHFLQNCGQKRKKHKAATLPEKSALSEMSNKEKVEKNERLLANCRERLESNPTLTYLHSEISMLEKRIALLKID